MQVPIWVSNRHIHLSQDHADILFGENYTFTPLKELSQPGQFAYKETITAKWPKGEITRIRILWPVRKKTQLEILYSDNYKLWINAPLRISGDLENSWGEITLIGDKWEIELNNGVIVAQRHLHVSTEQAKKRNLHNGQTIKIKIPGSRTTIFENVIIRAGDKYHLDFHIDREEWNASGATKNMLGEIIE